MGSVAPSDSIESYGLSPRGSANVEAIWPRISKAVAERERGAQDPCIDLGTSENWLLREELIELYKKAVVENLSGSHLSYPNGFSGDIALVNALAKTFNSYFKPHIPVEPAHLATAPGAAYALDALLFNICEAGDGVLVPVPCWNGFDWLLNVKAGVQPVHVFVNDFADVFTPKVIPALEQALENSPRPIKGLLFTNPHNPFGRCYPPEVIKDMIRFCDAKKIHFISDEIYALSQFDSPDLTEPVPFVSALQLDIQGMGCDLSRVHTIWSISKDLGSSGLRLGCCVTQANRPLVTGLALASNTQVSSLTAVAVTSLLTSVQLPSLLELNAKRLTEAYKRLTSLLRQHGLPYMPSHMGPFLFAKIAPKAKSWEDEADVIRACKKAGVSLSAGKSYHVGEGGKGWARINFALPPDLFSEALKRLGDGLDASMLQVKTQAEAEC